MNEEDLQKIETDLNLTIPPAYRDFLLNFPERLIFENAVDGHHWHRDHPDSGVFHTVRSFVEHTRSARAFKEEEWESAFPDDLLVVGHNGGGDYYCVRSGESGEIIHFFDHEWGKINPSNSQPLTEYIQTWIDIKEGRSK